MAPAYFDNRLTGMEDIQSTPTSPYKVALEYLLHYTKQR